VVEKTAAAKTIVAQTAPGIFSITFLHNCSVRHLVRHVGTSWPFALILDPSHKEVIQRVIGEALTQSKTIYVI
jgi:hypothetical protein